MSMAALGAPCGGFEMVEWNLSKPSVLRTKYSKLCFDARPGGCVILVFVAILQLGARDKFSPPSSANSYPALFFGALVAALFPKVVVCYLFKPPMPRAANPDFSIGSLPRASVIKKANPMLFTGFEKKNIEPDTNARVDWKVVEIHDLMVA